MFFGDLTRSSFLSYVKRRFNINHKLNPLSVFQVLRYKITDHRIFIPGFNTNNSLSPDELPFSAVNQRFIPKYFLAMLWNCLAIKRNKTFIPFNKSIIPWNKTLTPYYKSKIPWNKPILPGSETYIPENNLKILRSAFFILRNKPVIPERKFTTERNCISISLNETFVSVDST